MDFNTFGWIDMYYNIILKYILLIVYNVAIIDPNDL